MLHAVASNVSVIVELANNLSDDAALARNMEKFMGQLKRTSPMMLKVHRPWPSLAKTCSLTEFHDLNGKLTSMVLASKRKLYVLDDL